MRKTNIMCPRCGAEYLPQEIYIPTNFFGKASYIERDETDHKILEVIGTDLNTEETYTCDFCNTPFNITARITFSTKEEIKKNFDEDYSTSLLQEKILFPED